MKGKKHTAEQIIKKLRETDRAIVIPSHGRYVGAASVPFSEYKRAPGEQIGHNWRIPSTIGKRALRHVVYDTNFWKTFVHSRLKVAKGDGGCLALFGEQRDLHRLVADHFTAEYPITTTGRGRTVEEWKLRADRDDNHWFDCLVGSAVGASMLGARLPAEGPPKVRKKLVLSEIARTKRIDLLAWTREPR